MNDRQLLINQLLFYGYNNLAQLIIAKVVADFAINANALRLGKVNVGGFLRRTRRGFVPVRSFLRRDMLQGNILPRKRSVLAAKSPSFDSVLPSIQNVIKDGLPNAGNYDPFGNALVPLAQKSRQQLVESVQARTRKSFASPDGAIEYAHLMNGNTGQQYKAFTGSRHSVQFELGRMDSNVVVVHSHPSNVSLSLADLNLSSTEKRIKYALAVDSSGNVYTGAATAKYSRDDLGELHFQVKDKIEDYLVGAMRNSKQKPSKEDYTFLMMHSTNLNLRKKGAIAYNAEINSPYYQEFLTGWLKQIEEMTNL